MAMGWISSTLIAAAHQFGHIAESRLRRFEIGAHVESLVYEPRGEEPCDNEAGDDEPDDPQNPRPDAAALAERSAIVDQRIVGRSFGHEGILTRRSPETAVNAGPRTRKRGPGHLARPSHDRCRVSRCGRRATYSRTVTTSGSS